MDSVEMEICRLCFVAGNNQINIFDPTDFSSNVAGVINEHIGLVSNGDTLPKTVCIDCWNTTETFHKFHRFVKSAQSEFLNRAIKCELPIELEHVNELFAYSASTNFQTPNFVEVPQSDNNYDDLKETIFASVKCDVLDDSQANATNRLDSQMRSKDDFDELVPRVLQCSVLLSQGAFDLENNLVTKSRNNCHLESLHTRSIRRSTLKMRLQKIESTHPSTDHQNSVNKLICDFCGKTYSCKMMLKRHLMTHVNSFECKICEKRCFTEQGLEAHQTTEHNADTLACIKKQLDAIKDRMTIPLGTSEIEQTMSKHFDMACDICGDALKSLQQAQFHYMHEHKTPNGYIKCCDIKFEKNQTVYEHIVLHLDPEMFKCNVCGKMKNTVMSLRQHLKQHETRQGPKQNVCVECNRGFFRKQQLQDHMQKKHGIIDGSRNYMRKCVASEAATDRNETLNDKTIIDYFDLTCDICQATFASFQHAQLHYLDEHGIADGYIKCCDIKFKELNQVHDHLKFHLNPDVFKCHLCEKSFPRRRNLSAHLSRHKAVESKRYTCDVCKKACRSKHHLINHRQTHEKSAKTFQCELCTRRFASKEQQQSHQKRIHHKNEQSKTEICEFCAKTFGSRSEVRAHIQGMHMKTEKLRERVQCNVCDAWLSNRYTLKSHILRHTAEPQQCTQCNKIAPNQNALLLHIQHVHTERIHKCHLCDKSFKAAVALKDHVATHTGEKLYKCLYCPESFIWRPNCYSHQKKAHPREWSDDQLKKTKAKSQPKITK